MLAENLNDSCSVTPSLFATACKKGKVMWISYSDKENDTDGCAVLLPNNGRYIV